MVASFYGLNLIAYLLFTPISLRANTPWATNVVSYVQGTAPAPGYVYPQEALGRPSVMTYANSSEASPSTVVVPVYPPWEVDQLLSIGEGGSLVLEMGAEIRNDPANPYGVDFLVFGNALLSGGGSYDQTANDPRGYTLGVPSSLSSKWGEVSVSADGITWFAFPASQRVGALMPTLGKIWNGTAWGADSDPTLPPDPELGLSDIAGMALGELCRRYRGGAGGTGFDLEDLLVPEGLSLPSSFRFVKIEVPDDGNAQSNRRTEIDAVTVVSPVSGFVRWQQEHYPWVGDPVLEAAAASGEGDSFSNWQEFARGGDPAQVELELPLPVLSLNTNTLHFSIPSSALEAPWILESSSELEDDEAWVPLNPQPSYTDTPVAEGVQRSFQPELPLSGTRLFRLRLEEAP